MADDDRIADIERRAAAFEAKWSDENIEAFHLAALRDANTDLMIRRHRDRLDALTATLPRWQRVAVRACVWGVLAWDRVVRRARR